MNKYQNFKQRQAVVCVATLHCCVMGTAISNQPHIPGPELLKSLQAGLQGVTMCKNRLGNECGALYRVMFFCL